MTAYGIDSAWLASDRRPQASDWRKGKLPAASSSNLIDRGMSSTSSTLWRY